jgi:polysaccharide export outer membrane protein
MQRRICSFFIVVFMIVVGWSVGFADEGYVIGDEDVIQVSVWGSPELTIQVPVRPDGMITVPPVGDVKAAGLTPQKLKALLESELAKFVKSPTVSVVVTAVNSFKVFVIMEGGGTHGTSGPAPAATALSGAITLRRNTTLLQLLSQLGPLQNADLNSAYVLRNGQKLSVDMFGLVKKGAVSEDIRLMPNDMIFIPDNYKKRIMVLGEVRTPSVIPYREGMTALDAILSAGGFTEFANPNSVVVVRTEESRIKNIEVKLNNAIKKGDIAQDLLLQPGDRISVR